MKTINELMNLKGRRALITGAIGGIGQEMAMTVAELGGDLILLDQPESDFEILLSRLKAFTGIDIDCVECNLEDPDSRAEVLSAILSDQRDLDVLINNAAFVGTTELCGWVTDFENQSIETWNRVMETNLTAVFDLSQKLIPKLRKNKYGSIINIASIYGVNAPDYSLYEGTDMGNPAAYATSKAGIIQLSKWLSTTVAPDVRVNVISPGGVFRGQPKKFVDKYVDRTPLRRMANNYDFKGAVAFLSSDLSAYVTGQNIMVDGGWTVW